MAARILSGESDWSQYPGVEPWYNVSSAEPVCPSECRPCARCLRRSEQELLARLDQAKECDCAHVPIGIDPCFAPSSCACTCSRYRYVSEACPLRE